MAHLTPYQIADHARHLNGTASIAMINRLFARQDKSHLWPINGRFDATQRAIRRLRRLRTEVTIYPGLEYALALDEEISRVVNGKD